MPIDNIKQITTLKDYITINCTSTKVTLDEVDKYAAKGKQFLKAVMTGNPNAYPSDCKSDNIAYLHWYLIKESFNQKKPFSKGTFNLEGKDDESTLKLYEYLKGDNKKKDNSSKLKVATQFIAGLTKNSSVNKDQAYSRGSTHYNGHLSSKDGHFGIDKVTVPLAWKFETHVFGLCKNTDNSLSVYFKPETASADLTKTFDSMRHGVNLIKSLISKEKIEGMSGSFREDALSNDIKQFTINSFQKENILNKNNEKSINECATIPQLREIISTSKSNIDLDAYLISNHGSTNQIGSEQRFKISDDGGLARPIDFSSASKENCSQFKERAHALLADSKEKNNVLQSNQHVFLSPLPSTNTIQSQQNFHVKEHINDVRPKVPLEVQETIDRYSFLERPH